MNPNDQPPQAPQPVEPVASVTPQTPAVPLSPPAPTDTTPLPAAAPEPRDTTWTPPIPEAAPVAQPETPVDFGSWSKIVIVEDNIAIADIYKTRMEMIGYICFVAHEGNEALALIEREQPSLVLLDLMVPGVAGDQILKRMRASEWGKDIKVLIISNLNEADAPAGLRMQGIEGYVVKANLTDNQLDQMVNAILQHNDQQPTSPNAA